MSHSFQESLLFYGRSVYIQAIIECYILLESVGRGDSKKCRSVHKFVTLLKLPILSLLLILE